MTLSVIWILMLNDCENLPDILIYVNYIQGDIFVIKQQKVISEVYKLYKHVIIDWLVGRLPSVLKLFRNPVQYLATYTGLNNWKEWFYVSKILGEIGTVLHVAGNCAFSYINIVPWTYLLQYLVECILSDVAILVTYPRSQFSRDAHFS